MNQNSKVSSQGAYPISRTAQGMKVNLSLSQNHLRTLKFWYEPYSYWQNLWTLIGPLWAFPVVLVSFKKINMSDLCYNIILGSMFLAEGRQERTTLAEVPEVMRLALAVEVHSAWPTGSLHHSCPDSALTLSTIWHWFNPSFHVFSTPGTNFCFSSLLVPSLNQPALFWHWNAAKQPEGCELLAIDSEAKAEAEATKWLMAWSTFEKKKICSIRFENN